MLQELARDELADVACPDDDRVLEVGEPLPAGGTCRDACERHRADREQPDRDHAADVGPWKPGDPDDRDEHPGAERAELEDPGEVVGGRGRGALLVPVVETGDLGREHPGRNRDGEEHHGLLGRPEALTRSGVEELGEDEREREPDDVGRDERAADEPASSAGEPASMLEDAQCQLADLGQRRTFEHRRQRVSCRAHPAGPWSRSRARSVLRTSSGDRSPAASSQPLTVPDLERAAGNAGVQDRGAVGTGVGRRGCGIQPGRR